MNTVPRARYDVVLGELAEMEADKARIAIRAKEVLTAVIDVLTEHQDGRRIANVHTRQVAREIQQEIERRIGGRLT
jgi:hypothetical protein